MHITWKWQQHYAHKRQQENQVAIPMPHGAIIHVIFIEDMSEEQSQQKVKPRWVFNPNELLRQCTEETKKVAKHLGWSGLMNPCESCVNEDMKQKIN